MNPLTAVALFACLALSAAQGLTGTDTGSTGLASPTSGPLDASSGPLQPTSNFNNGPLSTMANPMATNNAANMAANRGSGINQVFQNPALSYGLMGGDNLMRALMVPYLSRYGSVPAWYYLRGGMDKFHTVLMSDMMNRALARSTGMNPVMSAFMTGQIFDAPDNYALSNMLFNGMGRNNMQTNGGAVNNGRAGGGGGGGLVPNGAAARSTSQNAMGGNSLAPLLFSSFLF